MNTPRTHRARHGTAHSATKGRKAVAVAATPAQFGVSEFAYKVSATEFNMKRSL